MTHIFLAISLFTYIIITSAESDDDDESPRKTRSGRKRSSRPTARSSSVSNKRGRKSSSSERTNMTPTSDSNVPAMAELVEKPDANMCLKVEFFIKLSFPSLACLIGVNRICFYVPCVKNPKIQVFLPCSLPLVSMPGNAG